MKQSSRRDYPKEIGPQILERTFPSDRLGATYVTFNYGVDAKLDWYGRLKLFKNNRALHFMQLF